MKSYSIAQRWMSSEDVPLWCMCVILTLIRQFTKKHVTFTDFSLCFLFVDALVASKVGLTFEVTRLVRRFSVEIHVGGMLPRL